MMMKVLLLLSIVIAIANGFSLFTKSDEFPLNVNSRSGAYQGIYIDNARAFLGVPYAKPPTGSLRFKPPQDKGFHWGIYNATKSAPSCFQSGATAASNYSEDCLYLDVYTPKYVQRTEGIFDQLPVMVFIHGGRYWTGSALDFPADKMAALGNAVVVVMQYRLNVFGFQPFDSNTNLGLLDQQLALKWVKDNVFAFGGDSNKVTIFGESAGGSSVLYHFITPSSYNLYDRVIAHSAWQWYIPTVETSRVKAATWAATKGCANTTSTGAPDYNAIVECLSTKDALSITATTAQSDFFVPMIDGRLITTLPLNSFKLKQYNQKAEIIIGHNYDEGNYMAYSRLGYKSPNQTVTDTTYYNSLRKYLNVYFNPTQVEDIVTLYEPVKAQLGNWYAGAEFFADYYIICGSILAAEYLNGTQTNFRTYIFNYSSPNYPANDWFLAASHGNELAYVFFTDIYTPFVKTPEDNLLSVRMNRAWTDFADTANPKSILSEWPTTYPSAMYYGDNANIFNEVRPYLKDICSSWRPYLEQY
ncbi:hypothetical protein DICPUDRAFT_150002 [Dictyostelium purpureum]|uniref:Carboxylic ester hydrolase n=1 Tax=Dictyostelium purpureum TaxID=5786 RepID=F0ZF74_DICPU|nr:uncharacterized protein DICPUDRAFT_150002 [Dictyostelium purpureum]EGC37401.1 hypothetical protein DICPUDRAFT_150002 [Dictyostelium purpureum]|eukprot:XP_003286054.1 hypothetical protein DICPUDRAFT_150002 [Dictyostelium purpureum]